MKKLVLVALLIAGIGMESAMARPHHRPEHRPGHGGHRNGDFGDGVLAGLLLSTASLFMSDITANHSQAVYLHADQDAATFLAEGGEPTPALAQAMNYERDFLARAEVQGSDSLSDQEVAYLVMRRAESL
ncbi:hypothetical protein EZJ49_10360 [Bdellovibrio bacteriovorus]|uniref:hypothetical protein n=1 Tax=Bdellovibrio bacteriovorus TaxID=959 RepID=UPI0021D20E53|nr:hypothetical protein [Bdellovibrio bacteriovorus]UXR63478.1 hypothetical protein EZJ49_10360 [Bdellovibrio bacteriovorus]